MSKYIASIPLGDIDRVQIYINKSVKTLAEIKAETGADYLINGGLYQGKQAVCHLRADGRTYAKDPYTYWGYAWDTGPDITLRSVPAAERRNYICCVCLLRGGKAETLIYNRDVGGSRPRTAIGLKDGALCLYCTDNGRTPMELQAELLALGWESAVMLDGGGSSQCDLAGKRIVSNRKVHNLILVYTRKRAPSEPDDSDKEEKAMSEAYQVTPSVGVNIRSGPGTGYSKVGAYAQGTVVTVTATRDGWGQTEKGWVSLDYLEAVEAAQRVTDNGLRIQARYIDAGRKNRPGGVNPCGYITIHETGNAARGADAAAHGSYLNSAAGEAALVSWHYTVDDHAIVQHLPDGETAYHAGDGPKGTGNARSIGVEICVNADGDFAKARENAASLVRLLMEEHGTPIGHVVQHNHWNGKDCPYTIRHTSGAWEAFLALCEGGPCAKTNRQTVQARFGLAEETMDYLEAYRYGADLLQKLAAAN
ncbi:N-acetylmuramoyl-L-alanine amidase [Intestinimonas butyriciproducens]|uniref:N-acetylmuramoyl-L-alanine amidase n=2 Tax=Intestinimonas butyriciproducens TaxID=1297617 RepID=UPI001A9AE22D|nr:N-acetylmuramoyl-L-alanine amidase [Intestinimonas butyriciproducens]